MLRYVPSRGIFGKEAAPVRGISRSTRRCWHTKGCRMANIPRRFLATFVEKWRAGFEVGFGVQRAARDFAQSWPSASITA